MDYRPLPDDRTEEFQEYRHYAFSLQEGPQDEHDSDPGERPGDPRALFDGDEMLCICRHHWFRTRLRGRWFEMPGLATVASPPRHRRKGNVVRLLAESLAEYRDRGDFLTALWAFEHSFYERQGWALATKFAQYDCAPETLSFARREVDTDAGEFRPVDADDHEALAAVLAADRRGLELDVDRTEQWWRERVFEGWRGEPYAYAWADDEGEIRSYVVYRVEDGDDGRRLVAEELAAADPEARLHCLRFLANHDSQVERVRFYDAPQATLLDRATDPAEVDCELKPGPMARLADVPRAIEALEYPDAPDAEFTLAVSDPLADWNDGTFRVAVEDGRATCEPIGHGEAATDGTNGGDADRADGRDADGTNGGDADEADGSAASAAEPDDDAADEAPASSAAVTTGVGPLSQVYVGYHSVADAETLTDLEVRDPAAREALSAMFPERDVFLAENF